MSPVLVNATVQTAVLLALGKSLNGTVAPSVFELMHDSVSIMRLSRVRYFLILAVLALLGGSALAWGTRPFQPDSPQQKSSSTANYSASSSCHSSSAQPKQ